MNLLWWEKRQLKTVWKVEKDDKCFFLVGTAHFSPYSFKKSLEKIIKPVRTVVFEGPLDSESMAKVAEYGRSGGETPSLYNVIDSEAIKKINKQLNSRLRLKTSSIDFFGNIFSQNQSDLLKTLTQGVRPWFGFFTIWSSLLEWSYSMDLEAYEIAKRLGKEIKYLETIEDQLASLDEIPFERIVNFINHIDQWKSYREMFLKTFLSGDIERFSSVTKEFPTRCESIVQKRDPIFFEGIKTLSMFGVFVAFIGIIHIPGVKKMLLEEGFKITQKEI